jgi:magnesium-transporting ATPase (P-type)
MQIAMVADRKPNERGRRLGGHWLAWLVLVAAIILPLAIAGWRMVAVDDAGGLMNEPNFALMVLTAIVAVFALFLSVMIRFAPGGISSIVWAAAILLVWGVGSVAYVLIFEAH